MKEKTGTGLVITGGEAPPLDIVEPYLGKADFIVAADSGLERALSYGVRPDLIVGDMDSLADKALLDRYDPESVKIYPANKDDTDTELALKELGGWGKKILIGGGEGRLDHTLSLLALFEGDLRPDLWISAREKVFSADRSMIIEGIPGETISFFPLGDRDIQFRSTGLVWPLDGVEWLQGQLSVSNRFSASRISLERVKGALLVIRSLPGSGA